MSRHTFGVGRAYHGRIAFRRNGKVKLTADFYKFMVDTMLDLHGKVVVASFHEVSTPPESIQEFIHGLTRKVPPKDN